MWFVFTFEPFDLASRGPNSKGDPLCQDAAGVNEALVGGSGSGSRSRQYGSKILGPVGPSPPEGQGQLLQDKLPGEDRSDQLGVGGQTDQAPAQTHG